VDPHQETELLLLVGDREPVFDQQNTRAHQHALEVRHRAKELLALLFGAEFHHALDAGTIIPRTVEQHDFSACRKVRDVALKIPLRPFALARRGQRGDPADARIESLGDALDDATLASGVAAFEDDDHLELVVLNPVLQLYQVALQAQKLPEVVRAVHWLMHLAGGSNALELLEPSVVELHLELFVQRVLKIGIDECAQVLVTGSIGLGHRNPLFATRFHLYLAAVENGKGLWRLG